MARITDKSIEDVKQNADFVAVVEERTSLRKAGARLSGRCPFHEERTPSFSVNPVDKFYYCFGCGAKGDMITFVRETQGVDFIGAIEWLADRFHIPLEYEEGTPGDDARRKRRARLYEVLEDAATFYERYLWDSQAGSYARDYLAGRGLREEVCREFRIGLAISGNQLTTKALNKGFTLEELQAAGLTRERGGDFFQRRLLFPLADARGRIVGFQARRLYEDDPLPAKYMNTRESELFSKSAVVYGLDKARAAMSKEDRACVVEGNTDVLALRQAGFQPVVASMGTALTEHQLREIGRITKRLVLAFDGDAAGESATLRGMELAVRQGFDVRVVPLPAGIDPADDPQGFQARLGAAKAYPVHWVEMALRGDEDAGTKYKRIKEFLDTIAEGPDRQDAWKVANDRLGMTVQLRATGAGARAGSAPSARLVGAGDRLERDVLAGAIAHPSVRPLLATLPADHFKDAAHRRIFEHLVHNGPVDDDVVGLMAELDARAAQAMIDEATTDELIVRMRERELRAELAHAELPRVKEIQDALMRLRGAATP